MQEQMTDFEKDMAISLQEAIDYMEDKPSKVRVTHYSYADAKAIRERLGLSQNTFAKSYNIPLDTLQNWEQKRTNPDRTANAYLWAIQEMPEEIKAVQARHPFSQVVRDFDDQKGA